MGASRFITVDAGRQQNPGIFRAGSEQDFDERNLFFVPMDWTQFPDFLGSGFFGSGDDLIQQDSGIMNLFHIIFVSSF